MISVERFAYNFFRHFKTVNRHRATVLRHCIKAGIPWRGLTHDLSKYSLSEFIPGVLYYQGNRSPNEKERESLGFSYAWIHHKGRNRHHFEYWCDYDSQTRVMTPVKMPLLYVKEMFCDRVAASKIYNGKNYTDGDPLSYFLNARQRLRKMMHPDTFALLEKLLVMLKDKGEEYTFLYIRRLKKY